jgi:putative SbcD/Mre11-related phosphoesterase
MASGLVDPTVKPVADQSALLLIREEERILVISDLHLGWEVSLARQGIHVPSQVPRLLDKLRHIIADTHPSKVVLLGDVKHAVGKVELEEWKYVPEFFEGLVEIIPEVQVIPGNHDGNLEPLTPPNVKISTSEGIMFWNTVGLFHGHAWPSPPLVGCKFLVMGHLHPVVMFKDPLGFRITRQAWVRAKSNGRKLAEGVLRFHSVKYIGDPVEEYKKRFGTTPTDADCIIMPSFNDYLGGQPINRPASQGWNDLYREYLGPVLRSGAVDFELGEAYLFDGTFLGTVQDLRKLAE